MAAETITRDDFTGNVASEPTTYVLTFMPKGAKAETRVTVEFDLAKPTAAALLTLLKAKTAAERNSARIEFGKLLPRSPVVSGQNGNSNSKAIREWAHKQVSGSFPWAPFTAEKGVIPSQIIRDYDANNGDNAGNSAGGESGGRA